MKLPTNSIAFFFAITIIFSSVSLSAKQESISVGAGIGLARGVNESKPDERSLGFLFGVYGLWNNAITNGLTPEFAFTYFSTGTSDIGGFSQYNTNFMNFDLRLRYEFLKEVKLSPYVFAGLGAVMFDVKDVPYNKDIDGKESGTTLGIPFGLGLKYDLTSDIAIDFNVGVSLSLTDDFNPVYDDIKDANWFGRFGVHFDIVKFSKDSDGDGLPDEEEIKIGTDPKNPDTDGDGLLDGEEVDEYKTDPLDPDTDKGGIKDGIEVRNNANPLDADDDILNIGLGEKLVLRGIEFVTGKSEITPKSERILNNAIAAMKKMPNTEFEIVGHTDDVGDLNNNIKLSQERAESVKKWLVDRGIDAGRLKTRGAGPNEPIVPNTSESNRQKNRRVEFIRSK